MKRSLVKVSDWNSLRVNQNYFDLFRNLYPSQSESFWKKTVKNQSDLIRLIPTHQSEPIPNQVFNPNQSELRFVRITPTLDWFALIWIESLVSDWFGFIRIDVLELNGLSRIVFWPFFIKPDTKRFSDWFRMILIENSVGSIQAQIDLDWKLGFGLVRIHSDWCLGINWIKSNWFLTVFHQTRYKTFFRLVRNDSHWLGYRYWNESE